MTIFLYLKPFLIALISSLVLTKAIIKYKNHFRSDCPRTVISSPREKSVCEEMAETTDPSTPLGMTKTVFFQFSDSLILHLQRFYSNKLPLVHQGSQFNREPADKKNTSRFGGAAIIISFLLSIFLSGDLEMDSLKLGIVVSSLAILFFGVYDDLKNLSWKKQLMAQIAVALIMIYAGLSVDYIANPFGGAEFRLDQYEFSIFNFQFSILGSLFVLLWIIGFMNVTNWLDGLDGLAGGVGIIGSLVLFFLSVSSLANQPPLGIISISVAGAALGFLVFNFHPAKIFMGTSGSMFLGFMLAVAAVFSGGKIATALLVMGFPILDAMWVLAQRIKAGQSPFAGDARHLHYQLLKNGWSERKVVLSIYSICLIFGVSALVFQSMGKILALLVLFFVMAVVVFGLQGDRKRLGNEIRLSKNLKKP